MPPLYGFLFVQITSKIAFQIGVKLTLEHRLKQTKLQVSKLLPQQRFSILRQIDLITFPHPEITASSAQINAYFTLLQFVTEYIL